MDTVTAYSHLPITSNKVGSWRFVEPFLEKKIAPCSNACPLNQNIRETCGFLDQGKTNDAFLTMAEKNPLLYATGTVCPHFCQNDCNRKQVDSSIEIGNIEAFLGKSFLSHSLTSLAVSKDFHRKIAVIGAGPAGLSAAFQAARFGAEVTLYERESQPGGMVQYGIPSLRLDKSVFQKEIQRIFDSFPSIRFEAGKELSPEAIREMAATYDEVILAIGNQKGLESSIPGILSGIDTLKRHHRSEYVFPSGGHYLVLGGGNTAMDVAYYLLHHKNQVTVLVRRHKNQMRAFPEEIALVEKLGAKILELSTLQNFDVSSQKAEILSQGESTILNTQGAFACFGQEPELPFQKIVFPENVLFAGDFTGGEATVTHAVASGAAVIHQLLKKHGVLSENPAHLKIADSFNLDYWKSKKKPAVPDAAEEASRCMQCGTCTACGVCETFCPDFAITTGEQAEFNMDYCKGCEICLQECPRNAISAREVQE